MTTIRAGGAAFGARVYNETVEIEEVTVLAVNCNNVAKLDRRCGVWGHALMVEIGRLSATKREALARLVEQQRAAVVRAEAGLSSARRDLDASMREFGLADADLIGAGHAR